MQLDFGEACVKHLLKELPDYFKQPNASEVAGGSLGYENHDSQEHLSWYLARLPDVLAQLDHQLSSGSRPFIPLLSLSTGPLLILCPSQPLLEIFRSHLGCPAYPPG